MYHGSAWLGSTIVHENGSLTLVETTLYASHALGHVPVVLVFALLTAGTWLCMTGGERPVRSRRIPILAAMVLTCVVIITIAISLSHFGPENT